jgi:hypothetical protein
VRLERKSDAKRMDAAKIERRDTLEFIIGDGLDGKTYG